MADSSWLAAEDASGRSLGWWGRFCLRAPRWPTLLFAVALLSYGIGEVSDPRVAMVGLTPLHAVVDGCFGLFLLFALRCGQLLAQNHYEVRYRIPHEAVRSPRCWPLVVVILGGGYLLLCTRLPMQMAFAVSRPAMDRLAAEALADPDNTDRLAGRWTGLYRIAGVEVIGSTVVLYLGKDRGSYGFARVPGAALDRIRNGGQWANHADTGDFPRAEENRRDVVGLRINGDWFVMYDYYRLVKIGWS